MMVRLIILLLLGTSSPILAQSEPAPLKIYAYSQYISIGMNNPVIDVDGKSHEPENSRSIDYYIYVEIQGNQNYLPLRLWLNEKCYSVKQEQVPSPVIRTKTAVLQGTSPYDTLVRPTRNPVYSLRLMGSCADSPQSNKSKTMLRQNALVLEYRWNNKIRYQSLHRIVSLASAAMQ